LDYLRIYFLKTKIKGDLGDLPPICGDKEEVDGSGDRGASEVEI
jgi:hypothetical protein